MMSGGGGSSDSVVLACSIVSSQFLQSTGPSRENPPESSQQQRFIFSFHGPKMGILDMPDCSLPSGGPDGRSLAIIQVLVKCVLAGS